MTYSYFANMETAQAVADRFAIASPNYTFAVQKLGSQYIIMSSRDNEEIGAVHASALY